MIETKAFIVAFGHNRNKRMKKICNYIDFDDAGVDKYVSLTQ